MLTVLCRVYVVKAVLKLHFVRQKVKHFWNLRYDGIKILFCYLKTFFTNGCIIFSLIFLYNFLKQIGYIIPSNLSKSSVFFTQIVNTSSEK